MSTFEEIIRGEWSAEDVARMWLLAEHETRVHDARTKRMCDPTAEQTWEDQ